MPRSALKDVLYSRIYVKPGPVKTGRPGFTQPPYDRKDTAFHKSERLISHKGAVGGMLRDKKPGNRYNAVFNFCVASKLSAGVSKDEAISACKERVKKMGAPEEALSVVID